MKKIIFAIFISVFGFAFLSNVAFAQQSATQEAAPTLELPETQVAPAKDEFFKAKVLEVKDEVDNSTPGYAQAIQKVKIRILDGSEKGKELDVDHGSLFAITDEQKVKVGEEIVVTKTQGPTGELYYITDKYRLNGLLIIFGIFFALAIIFGKLRGATSILGLIVSIGILLKFVVPQILMGRDPIMVSISGALVIAVLSIYLSHGISKRTSIALFSTIITLGIAAFLAVLYVGLTKLTGTGSEEAIFLRMGPVGTIDLKGLLLGGIIIGSLGVLDDITISQSAAVDEISKANPNLGKRELFNRGLSIGREHIASLINTLALAYVGASFPLMLLFSISKDIPLWLTANSEFIAEEVIRTLVGSTALILAVPIATFMAAYFLGNKSNIVEMPVTRTKKATRRKKN